MFSIKTGFDNDFYMKFHVFYNFKDYHASFVTIKGNVTIEVNAEKRKMLMPSLFFW